MAGETYRLGTLMEKMYVSDHLINNLFEENAYIALKILITKNTGSSSAKVYMG